MKNMQDGDKNKNVSSIPDPPHSNKTKKEISKHRIIHYDWTICLIQKIITCQIEVLVLTLYKKPLVRIRKTRIIKTLQRLFRQAFYFVQKE